MQGSHGRERTARSSGVRCRITGGAAPSGSVGAGVKRIVYWPGRHKGKSMGGPFGKTAYVPVSVSSCNARIMYVNHDKVARWEGILSGSTTTEPRPVFFRCYMLTSLPQPRNPLVTLAISSRRESSRTKSQASSPASIFANWINSGCASVVATSLDLETE